MANTVRVVDAIAYLTARREKFENRATENRKVWEHARIKYERGLWFRIFKTPFEKTDTGRHYKGSFFQYPAWDFVKYGEWVEEINYMLATLEYHRKLGDTRIEWGQDWEDGGWPSFYFYEWCRAHNRPS